MTIKWSDSVLMNIAGVGVTAFFAILGITLLVILVWGPGRYIFPDGEGVRWERIRQ